MTDQVNVASLISSKIRFWFLETGSLIATTRARFTTAGYYVYTASEVTVKKIRQQHGLDDKKASHFCCLDDLKHSSYLIVGACYPRLAKVS